MKIIIVQITVIVTYTLTGVCVIITTHTLFFESDLHETEKFQGFKYAQVISFQHFKHQPFYCFSYGYRKSVEGGVTTDRKRREGTKNTQDILYFYMMCCNLEFFPSGQINRLITQTKEIMLVKPFKGYVRTFGAGNYGLKHDLIQ